MNPDGIIERISDKAAESNPRTDADYIEDGLLYCGMCHTPKQLRIRHFLTGEPQTVNCLCKCAAERRDAERAAREREESLQRIRRMRNTGFHDDEMRAWTFENDDHANPKVMDVARRYVDHFAEMLDRGKGILFYGGVGTGKTYAAASIANALIDQGHPCLVTNFVRLTNQISESFEGRQDYIDNISKYKLLVIDDFASERNTEYMAEMVTNTIDARYRSGLPLIVTTNLTASDLKTPPDLRHDRIYSRVLEMCVPVEVTGGDRRIKRMRDDYKDLKDILGL